MAHHYFKFLISFTGLFLISVGLAKADITRYVDADGIVTYTNLPYQSGDSKSPVLSQNDTSEAGAISASHRSRSDDWANKRLNPRTVPLDVETMKAAKYAILVLDQAAPAMRPREFIAYDQRNQGWFDFR